MIVKLSRNLDYYINHAVLHLIYPINSLFHIKVDFNALSNCMWVCRVPITRDFVSIKFLVES